MCVCGYNAKMGMGIRLLLEGMFEAILSKSRDEGMAFEEVLRRELIEIPQINSALGLNGPSSLAMFRGLNVLALAYFSDVLRRSGGEASDKKHFMAGVERFITVLQETEQYNSEVPGADPRTENNVAARAACIGEWVMKRYGSAEM